MPRDPRPWIAYPLNYTSHPRLEGLSDAAFRVFHQMNDYSRIHGLDGVIPAQIAVKRWRVKVLAELVAGIDDRPLVTLTDAGYFLRSYAEHQFTTTDAADLTKKRAAAGAIGGKAKQEASKRLASATANGVAKTKQNVADIEIEIEETTSKDVVPRKRGNRIPDPFIVTGDMRAWAASKEPTVDVNRATEKFVNYWRAKTRDATKLDWLATWQNWLMTDADRQPTAKATPTQKARRTMALASDLVSKELE